MAREWLGYTSDGIQDHRTRCLQGFCIDKPASLAVLNSPAWVDDWIVPLLFAMRSLAAAGGSNRHAGDLNFEGGRRCHCACRTADGSF
jgi:hypothetical protein